ncbi:Prophage tail length tape measure protein [compost metagenome]
MDALAGVTQSSASAALTQVAGSGKFAGEQIQLVATVAEQMRVATGQAVAETVAEFERLATDPIAAILKLNETQHFLTEAQLEQLRTLRDQQGQQAAATEAMRVYAAVIADRTPQVNENLGSIERAWRNIKDVARETVDGLLSIGRAPDDAQRVAELTQRIAYLKSTVGTGFEPLADTQGEIARLSAELDALTAKQKAAADSTKSTVDSAAETARQTAADSFVKGTEAQVQSLQKLSNVQRAHAVMQEQGITETSTLGQRMLQAAEAADKQKAATDAATEAERKADAARRKSEQQLEAAGRKAEQAAKQQLNYVQGLEKQAATIGMSSAQVREYELAERSMTGALHERAAAALVVIDAEERKRQVDADGKQLVGLQAQLLAAQGQTAAATSLQLEQQYGELLERLKARGDQAGVDLVNSLINAEQAKSQLSELQAQIDAVFAEQARREQTINTQQQAGLISELGARQQILDLNRETADQVEKLLPKMRELAAATGDQASIERLKDLELRLANLRTVANEFSNALKAGFENGIQSALEGLATGTMNLQEAATSFLQSIAGAMANLSAQQLAQMATSSIMGMFGSGADSGAGLTTGAAAVTTSAGALSAAGGTLITGAAAIEAAAASLALANGASGGGGGSGGAGVLASLAGALSSGSGAGSSGAAGYTGAFGFSDGGHVLGAGTTTSDSIPAWLSNYEFVTRAAVVQQPGALDFLHEFNARGMAALANWAPRVRHATGGLAGVPAPALPAPALPAPTLGTGSLAEPAKAMGATIKNAQNFYLLDDPSRVADAAFNSRAGEESFVVMLSKDPARYRSILGIN